MTSFDSASQRLEKSLDRLESAVVARVARMEAEGRDASVQSRVAADAAQAGASAAEARADALAEANRDVGRRLDDTIDRITRLLES